MPTDITTRDVLWPEDFRPKVFSIHVSDGPRVWHRMVVCARCGCPIAVWESQECALVEAGMPVTAFHCAYPQDCQPRQAQGDEA